MIQIPSNISVDMQGVCGRGVIDFTLLAGYNHKNKTCGLTYRNDETKIALVNIWCSTTDDCLVKLRQWLEKNHYDPNKKVYKISDFQPI